MMLKLFPHVSKQTNLRYVTALLQKRTVTQSSFPPQPVRRGGKTVWETQKGARNFIISLDRSLEPLKAFPLAEKTFPGAISNPDLVSKVSSILSSRMFTPANTLLATSLCCDELARELEYDFTTVYGKNFNLGGLSGFPFAGRTGFGAMAAHVPDDGYCLVVHGPHVGITEDGIIGKVERSGIALVDTCCGSAIAASNYLKGITEGGAEVRTNIQSFTDFQQGAVQELILPHGKRLSSAENRMVELPYALYESQDLLIREIISKGSSGIKKGLALLGGIQVNTGPKTNDYFVPLRFDYMNSEGTLVENLLPELTKK